MILIRTDNTGRITSYHSNPEKLTEEQVSKGILVEQIPDIEQRTGKQGLLMYDDVENSVYVDYVDRPLTDTEKIDKLQNDIDYLILKQEGLI